MKTAERPLIGVSANYMAPASDRKFYIGKALQYAEQDMLHWIWRCGGTPLMIPLLPDESIEAQLADALDGLVLTGGEDISPTLYG
ncbi:MAG: gamma-glutamyl-gamma-aminobutyrate hydrolase family protein, partial [Myxococcales bacterium]|nr:gamma-glutamyl-gamma-aminobutyrate hydrolase family protein [Myxococcales bacterium]